MPSPFQPPDPTLNGFYAFNPSFPMQGFVVSQQILQDISGGTQLGVPVVVQPPFLGPNNPVVFQEIQLPLMGTPPSGVLPLPPTASQPSVPIYLPPPVASEGEALVDFIPYSPPATTVMQSPGGSPPTVIINNPTTITPTPTPISIAGGTTPILSTSGQIQYLTSLPMWSNDYLNSLDLFTERSGDWNASRQWYVAASTSNPPNQNLIIAPDSPPPGIELLFPGVWKVRVDITPDSNKNAFITNGAAITCSNGSCKNLTSNGSITVTGTLAVSETANLNNGAYSVAGNLTVTEDLNCQGGTFTITGTTQASNISFSGTILTLNSGTLIASGNVSTNAIVNASGTITATIVSVNSTLTLNSDLTINGNTTANITIVIDGSLTVNGNATLGIITVQIPSRTITTSANLAVTDVNLAGAPTGPSTVIAIFQTISNKVRKIFEFDKIYHLGYTPTSMVLLEKPKARNKTYIQARNTTQSYSLNPDVVTPSAVDIISLNGQSNSAGLVDFAYGTVEGSGNSITVATNDTGYGSFGYVISDMPDDPQNDGIDSGVITIQAVDVPTIVVYVTPGEPVQFTVPDVFNINIPVNGTITNLGGGDFSYNPFDPYPGGEDVTYAILDNGQTIPGTIRFRVAASIHGQVRNIIGEVGVDNINVMITGTDYNSSQPTDGGVFNFKRLRPGTYTVKIHEVAEQGGHAEDISTEVTVGEGEAGNVIFHMYKEDQ